MIQHDTTIRMAGCSAKLNIKASAAVFAGSGKISSDDGVGWPAFRDRPTAPNYSGYFWRPISVRSMMFFTSMLLILTAVAATGSDAIRVGSFADLGLDGWTVKKFKGETKYRIVEDNGQKVLQASSHGTASGLVYKIEFNPEEYPILSWRWKVDNIITKGDSRTKAGDDYAARVYVVFPHWFFPKTRTLNYIWANLLPRETIQANVFTGNAMMFAVESGPEKAGQWLAVSRNIVDDYRRAFDEDPPTVGAIAIMTDTDNSGETATAWYGDITVSRN
jgi:hypothetical protein